MGDGYLPADRMPEAEVALRLAGYLLREQPVEPVVEVAIDGAQAFVGGAEVFPVARFLETQGWVQQEQRGRNAWTGTYRAWDG